MVPHPSVRLSLILVIASLACGLQTPASGTATPSEPTLAATAPVDGTPEAPGSPTPAPDHVVRVRNAEYQLGIPDSLQVVELSGGSFEQGAPGGTDFISVQMTDFVAAGDINGDGREEIAALLSENYGGTGTFVFLAVYTQANGVLEFMTSTLVDDRPQILALSIEEGEVFLDAVVHGFEEPLCCPTLRTTRHYRLGPINQLEMTDYATFTPDSRPRTITIESPASGAEVFSAIPIRGSVAIAPFENNLVYSIKDVGGVELARGALSVSAPEAGAPGTFDASIPLGRILSGAVIRLEVQDISAADGSLLAMDSVELVVK